MITKDMADFQAVKLHFESNSLSFYFFLPNSEKPIKSVIRHLPINTPAEDIAEGLVDLSFEVVSVRQQSTRRSLGGKPVTLPLFLITLPRTTKSQKLLKLSNLSHIAIKVEAYRSQNPLAQCYTCQKFGHVWANCKQPPRCLWCGGGHLHRDCPEKGKLFRNWHAVTANWRKERRHIPPTTAAAGMLRKKCARRRNHRNHQKIKLEGCFLPTLEGQMYLRCSSQRPDLTTEATGGSRKRSRAPEAQTQGNRSVSSSYHCKQ
jgi:hypothetical protein